MRKYGIYFTRLFIIPRRIAQHMCRRSLPLSKVNWNEHLSLWVRILFAKLICIYLKKGTAYSDKAFPILWSKRQCINVKCPFSDHYISEFKLTRQDQLTLCPIENGEFSFWRYALTAANHEKSAFWKIHYYINQEFPLWICWAGFSGGLSGFLVSCIVRIIQSEIEFWFEYLKRLMGSIFK